MTRVGASRIFFDVVAKWQADKLLYDVETSANVMRAVLLDSFDAALGPLSDFGIRIDQLVEEVKELGLAFGEARVGFEKFIDISNQQALDNMNDSLVEMGLNYAMTGVETMEAAQRMAQMGAVIGQQNVQVGTELGVLFAMISGMETETAMRRLTNLQQQTNFMYGENTRAQFMAMSAQEQQIAIYDNTVNKLNALNTVENRSIATMEQLTFTMNQFAAQGHLVGESIEEMAAMSATLIEAGEQQGAAGRALRMMYARLGGNISGTADKLREFNIETHDSEGNMLALTDIMQQLRDKGWDNSTEGQKQNIAQTIAGNRHYVRFIKLMENYDRRLQLTQEAEAGYMGALEERNRLLQNETKIYQKVTAQVDEYKTKIGTALLPAMTEAQKVQLNYNKALEGFVSGRYGEAFGAVAENLVKAREVMRVQGGFLELQLTVQAISIGLGTIRSVLAGITGETIANDSAYRAYRFNVEAAGYDIDKQKRTMQQIKMLTNEQASVGKELSFLAKNTSIAKDQQLKVEKQLDSLRANEQALTTSLENSALKRLQFKTQEYGQQVLAVKNMTKEFLTQRTNENELIQLSKIRRDVHKTITNQLRETVPMMKASKKELVAAHRELDEQLFTHKQIEIQIRKYANLYKSQVRSGKELTQLEIKRGNIAIHEYGRMRKKSKELLNERKYIAGSIMDYDTMIYKKQLELNLTKEYTALRKFAAAAEKGQQMTLEEIVRLEQLSVALGVVLNQDIVEGNSLRERQRQILREQVNIEKEINAAVELRQSKGKIDMMQNATAMQKAKVAGMGFAATLNMMSMVIPMVTSSENGMRMSMIATTLAMFPMIMQMGKATLSMAQMGATAMTTGKAIQFALGGGLIGVGLFMLVEHFSDTRKEAAKAAEEAKNLEAQLMRIQAAQSRLLGQKDKQTELFATDEIAESLGLVNLPLVELANNSELLNEALIETKAAFSKVYNDEQKSRLQDTVTLLEEMQSAQESMARLDAGDTLLATSESDFSQYASRFGSEMIDALREETSSRELHMFGDLFKIETEQDISELQAALGLYTTHLEKFGGDYSDAMDDIDKYLDDRGRTLSPNFNQDTENQMQMLNYLFSVIDDTGGNAYTVLDTLNKAVEDGNSAIQAYSESVLSFSEDVMDGASLNVTEFEADLKNVNEEMFAFANNAEELFFGGKFGNVTGSLYKQVVTQGVGTLYNKNEVLVSNNFHGFFNEKEAADKIIAIVTEHLDSL